MEEQEVRQVTGSVRQVLSRWIQQLCSRVDINAMLCSLSLSLSLVLVCYHVTLEDSVADIALGDRPRFDLPKFSLRMRFCYNNSTIQQQYGASIVRDIPSTCAWRATFRTCWNRSAAEHARVGGWRYRSGIAVCAVPLLYPGLA